MTSTASARLFLSYSRKDLAAAQALRDEMGEAGYDVRLDLTDIAAGEDWKDRLGRLIVEADTVVFCLTPHSIASPICNWEVEEADRLGKRILPVLLSKVAIETVPATLARLNFIQMQGRAHQAGLAKLKDALTADLPWLREHTRLGDLALQWQAKPGNSGVLRGDKLADAERWIASQPRDAALATDLHRDFIAASRKAASQRQRNWIAGAAAIVMLSLGLAGWSEINRREAVKQTALAEQQRDRAEKVLAAASKTASGLVFDLALEFRDVQGVPVAVIRKILDKAQGMQTQLGEAGESTPELQRMESAGLNELSVTLLAQGDTQGALAAARRSLFLAKELSATQPGNTLWRRDVYVSLNKFGDSLKAQGNLAEALTTYNEAMTIVDQIIMQDMDNQEWQRDLFISHERIGDVLTGQGDLTGALINFQSCLAIVQKLAIKDPDNIALQRDISVAHEKIGDTLMAQANLATALISHQASLAIRNTISKLEPANIDILNRLSNSHERIGTIQLMQKDLDGALASYRKQLAIAEKLVAEDQGNFKWQWGLLVGHEKIGDILVAQGDHATALSRYQSSINIAERLVAQDPNNMGWKRGLSVSNQKIGDTLMALSDAAGAKLKFQTSLTIMETLSAAEPGNAEWQRDLWICHWKLGAAGENSNGNYRKALGIMKEMASKGILAPADEPHLKQLEAIVASLLQ